MRGSFSHDLWKKGLTVWERKIRGRVLSSLLRFLTTWTEAFRAYTISGERKRTFIDHGIWSNTVFGGCPNFQGASRSQDCSGCHPWDSVEQQIGCPCLANDDRISLRFTAHLCTVLFFFTSEPHLASFDDTKQVLNMKRWLPTRNLLFSWIQYNSWHLP